MPFLDVEVSQQQGKFVTTVYRKLTLSGAYIHFDGFLPMEYKVGMIYFLAYRCFKICSDWTKFHEELNFWKHVSLKNGYPFPFIDKCFKMVINKLVIKRPQLATVEKKTSLQTRTKLRKSFKGILIVVSFKLFSKVKEKSLIFSNSKIVYLST